MHSSNNARPRGRSILFPSLADFRLPCPPSRSPANFRAKSDRTFSSMITEAAPSVRLGVIGAGRVGREIASTLRLCAAPPLGALQISRNQPAIGNQQGQPGGEIEDGG